MAVPCASDIARWALVSAASSSVWYNKKKNAACPIHTGLCLYRANTARLSASASPGAIASLVTNTPSLSLNNGQHPRIHQFHCLVTDSSFEVPVTRTRMHLIPTAFTGGRCGPLPGPKIGDGGFRMWSSRSNGINIRGFSRASHSNRSRWGNDDADLHRER